MDTSHLALIINAGSSSLKFALFDIAASPPTLELRGAVTGIGAAPELRLHDTTGGADGADLAIAPDDTVGRIVQRLVGWLETQTGPGRIVAAGHRVALGRPDLGVPRLVDDALIERLRALGPLAPLHVPRNLEPIEALRDLLPDLPQVACFDTAFHRTMPPVATAYALPRELTGAGIVRYGFHGLSYEYVSEALPAIDERAARGRTIIAHLGSGASMCALLAGRSIATTMGFSPLSGLVMTTRPGEVDPGVILWLMRERAMDADAIERLLYRESGLLGVSGISGDMRELLASSDPRARLAVDLFVYRAAREIGSLAAALGGLDALVFTGGIGEHSPPVRAAICVASAWLGLAVDHDANGRHGPRISTESSETAAWVIPTDEELMIARHTRALLAARSPTQARDGVDLPVHALPVADDLYDTCLDELRKEGLIE